MQKLFEETPYLKTALFSEHAGKIYVSEELKWLPLLI
jgi:hypothetical protein